MIIFVVWFRLFIISGRAYRNTI